jgi:antitoxin component YwqK of YwqJK toxin-antitoxin module/S1-C subfamily serine protease
MKKFILFFFFPLCIFSQINTAEYYLDSGQSIFYFDEDWKKAPKSEAKFYRIATLDSNNVPIGEIKDYYKSGKIQSIIDGATLLDNNDDSNSIWQGKSKLFYESGELSSERIYVNGKLEGNQKSFHKSGSIKSSWNTINGKVDGIYKAFYESGKIEVVENWNNGIKLDYQSFHENDVIKSNYKLINGKIDGEYKSFYDNGSREQEANFINGRREGLLRNFDINGKLSFISKWENGKKFFEETFFENGQIQRSYGISQLEDGSSVISGNWKQYNAQGILIDDNNYNEKGNYDGQSKSFDNQGKILSVSEWVDGVSISEIRYHPITGKTILNIKREGDRTFEERFPEGNKVWKWEYDKDWNTKDDVEGEFIPLYYRYQFFKGATPSEGASDIFNVTLKYQDGSPKLLYSVRWSNSNYVSIKKSKYYYDNGNLKQIISWNDEGKRDGDTDYFNEDGSFDRSVSYKDGVIDLWNYKCDDNNQNCEYTYTSYFSSKEDAEAKGWAFFKNDTETSLIPSDKYEEAENRYYWEIKKDYMYNRTITLPIDDEDDFQFSTTVNWWTGINNQYFGIVVGYKDWENYTALRITSNGFHKADIIKKGVKIGMEEGKYVKDGGYSGVTKLNIVRINGKLIFSVDGKPVYTSEYGSLAGDRLGFINSGLQSVLFDNVKVIRTPKNRSSRPPNNPPSSGNGGDWAGNGSGIILTTDGYIATNNHVIEGVSDIEVEFLYNNEIKSFNAKVIQTDSTNDLAIIKIEDSNYRNLSSIPYNFKTRSADVGEEVFALGYPMALSIMGKEIKFTDGRISSKSGFQGDITTYQSTTPIQGGNSGGPLFDSKGNLIAINSAKLKSDVADNVSYSIKSSYLLSLIDALPQTIKIPSSTILYSQSLPQKIKTLSKYVVLIKVR